MSVIIVKRKENGFIMCGDSQATQGTQRNSVTKIFKSKDDEDLFIGGVGTLRDINIVMTITKFIDANALRRDSLSVNSIVTYSIPLLQKILKENGRLIQDKDGELCWNSSLLIVYKNHAFEVGQNFEVLEIEDFCAIGSPQNFAHGAYSVLKKIGMKSLKLNEYDLVKEIIKMCIEETIHVFYPINIIDTTTDKDFKKINGGIVEFKIEEEKV